MGWRRIRDKILPPKPGHEDEASVPARPLHVSPRRKEPRADDRGAEARLTELRRRRDALLYDIDQGLLAQQPEIPWQDRINLLTEALATVESDLAGIDARPVEHRPPVEPIPIDAISAGGDDLVRIEFRIAGEHFVFEEQADWDERGGPTVRGDLQPVAGDVSRLVPPSFGVDDRRALNDHLRESIAVFASNLRDRSLAGDPMPQSPTLRDLARPCPKCGGWMDWNGRCDECAFRDLERQRLRSEANRLDDERRKEAEERHRLADGLPISQRRLMAVEADIRALGGEIE
jgi:hypothetical protein